MKRLTWLCLILLGLFVMGCNKPDFSTEEYLPLYDMRQDYNGLYPMCEQDGIYYFNIDQCIRYYDSTTHQGGILCKREAADDGGVLNSIYIGLCLYNNRLYWVEGSRSNSSLYSVNLQGTDRKRMLEMNEELSGGFGIDIHRGYLYTETVKKGTRNGKRICQVQVACVELENPKYSKVIFKKEYEDSARIDCVFKGNAVYIAVSGKSEMEVHEYDLANKELEKIYSRKKSGSRVEILEHIRVIGNDLYMQYVKQDPDSWRFYEISVDKVDVSTHEFNEVFSFTYEDMPRCFLGEDYALIYSGTVQPAYYYSVDYDGNKLYEGEMSLENDKGIWDIAYEYVGGDQNQLIFVRTYVPEGIREVRDVIIVDVEKQTTELIWSGRAK